MEINFQTVFEIENFYFCPRTLEAYKMLKERNLISFFFLFCPMSFHAAAEYIVI